MIIRCLLIKYSHVTKFKSKEESFPTLVPTNDQGLSALLTPCPVPSLEDDRVHQDSVPKALQCLKELRIKHSLRG